MESYCLFAVPLDFICLLDGARYIAQMKKVHIQLSLPTCAGRAILGIWRDFAYRQTDLVCYQVYMLFFSRFMLCIVAVDFPNPVLHDTISGFFLVSIPMWIL